MCWIYLFFCGGRFFCGGVFTDGGRHSIYAQQCLELQAQPSAPLACLLEVKKLSSCCSPSFPELLAWIKNDLLVDCCVVLLASALGSWLRLLAVVAPHVSPQCAYLWAWLSAPGQHLAGSSRRSQCFGWNTGMPWPSIPLSPSNQRFRSALSSLPIGYRLGPQPLSPSVVKNNIVIPFARRLMLRM